MSAAPTRMPFPAPAPRSVAVFLIGGLLLADFAAAGLRKANKLYRQGRTAEISGLYDEALDLYAQASRESPRHSRFSLAERRMRFVAGQAHVVNGVRLRNEGRLEEALASFERAIGIDPASSVAAQERIRTLDLVERAAQSGDELSPASYASALDAEHQERARRVLSMTEPANLQPLSSEPINLMLNETAKVVFETIGKLAGINLLFDKDFSDPSVEIELRNTTLTEALDYMSRISSAFWVPLTHNTAIVVDDNPNKRREFEDEVLKTVYLTNLSTPQDLAEVSTAIRGILDLRRMFTVNSMSAIVMRGPRAKVAIAEKLVHDMDRPKPEVIIDVLVLETSKSSKENLGLSPVAGSNQGISLPIPFGAQGGGADASTAVPVNRLGTVGLGSWSTTLPGFSLRALFSNSDTELLQSPRVRAADNQQADLRIGDRIPIATGSFQPGVGGVGISPLVNTQFTYTDVGVNVSLTPKIHANRDVSMHVEIEISNVREFVDIGGISQPVIGQRTIQHDVRVREGESSVIGGLNQTQVFKTRSGVPFLGELPVIGRLFSDSDVQRSESEILLVLIPHIVRMPGIDESNLRTIATGTDQKFEVRYVETGNGKPALAPLDGAGAGTAGQAVGVPVTPALPDPLDTAPPAPSADPAVPSPDPADPVEPTVPEPAPPAAPAPAEPAQPVPAERAAGQSLYLAVEPRSVAAAVGEEVSVEIVVRDALQLASMPLRIQYDRERVRLAEVVKGPFLSGADASDIIFSRALRHRNGLAAVNVQRFPGSGGADGDGTLVTLSFEALAQGEAQVQVFPTSTRTADGESLGVDPLSFSISVQ